MTTMNTCSLLLLVAVAGAIVCTLAPSPATADPYLCAWRTVAHPEDPFIQSLCQWAIEQEHVYLHFEKVESAKAQCIGQSTSQTRNYELIFYASIRDVRRKYRAVVYVINFTQPQKLVSWGLAPGAN